MNILTIRGMVQEQIQDTLLRRRNCPECGQARHRKGHHDITIRTLFGNIEWKSPRLEHCRCQPHAEKTFSPLQAILPEHTSPEMLYLEVKWGYGQDTAKIRTLRNKAR